VERRLQQPPMTQMRRPLTGQQSVAEHSPGAFECAPFAEILLVGDQYLANIPGVVQQECVLGAKADVDDVAVGAREIREKAKRVAVAISRRHNDVPRPNVPLRDQAVRHIGVFPRKPFRGGWRLTMEDEERAFRRVAKRAGHEDVAPCARVFHALKMIRAERRALLDEVVDHFICEQEIHPFRIANLFIGSLVHWLIRRSVNQRTE
jgi:hypothetical protein